MRYALKVYYNGRNFYGSQVQPDKRTVEGDLLKAFSALGAKVEGFQGAGRTDRGVSALGNVYAVTTDINLKARALNSHLSRDVRVLSVKAVHDDFKARKEAIERVYKYFLPADGLDIKAMQRASKLFEGEKSFHNFCKTSPRPTTRNLKKIAIEKKDDFLVLSFVGDSFLWEMARRITNALKMVGSGEINADDLKKYFEPDKRAKLPPAPPEGLVLWKVMYDFEFEPEEYSIIRLKRALEENLQSIKTSARMEKELLGAL